MVQSVLFLLFGFLSAILLALMVAPAIWRRAVFLTKRRIEASQPLSLNELRAEKDQVRAEAAMDIRRLEIQRRSLNDKTVVLRKNIDKQLDQIKDLEEKKSAQAKAIEGFEADIAALNGKFDDQVLDNQKLADKLTSACDQIEVKIAENDHLARLYDEASLVSSNRQIDLVAAEAKVEQLAGEIDALKTVRGELETQLRDLSAASKIGERASELQIRKIDKLESRLEKMVATLSDAEEKVSRREKELSRLKEKLKEQRNSDTALQNQLADAEKEYAKMEKLLAMKSGEHDVPQENDIGKLQTRIGQLEEERVRLETRLKAVVGENQNLKREQGVNNMPAVVTGDDEQKENAELRTQINHLAAEIVNLTALLSGPNSDISGIVRDDKGRSETISRSSSIADRVRALREAAVAAHHTGAE